MPWTFTQEGPNPKTITLDGWAQPFGRPRLGEILDIGVKVVRELKRMPGKGVDPIINAFTSYGNDWHMTGRWMDVSLAQGIGASFALRHKWVDFVSDMRTVIASWTTSGQGAPLLSYRIFINHMPMKAEAGVPGQIAWEMYADVITDFSQSPPIVLQKVQTPVDMSKQMNDLIPKAVTPWTNPLGAVGWALAILPTLAQAMSLVATEILVPFNLVYQLTSQISDFASATREDLIGLATGVGQCQTGFEQMRQSTDLLFSQITALQIQYATSTVLGQQTFISGPNMIALGATKLQSDIANTALLALLADIQAQVQAFIRGRTQKSYTAVFGDTWESIALVTLGSVSAAQDMRQANGVQYGELPIPGKSYNVPSQQ